SVCFQVPGLVKAGLTIVISPLIALMNDQVERLNRMGIPATYINSTMRRGLIDRKLEGAMKGEYRFLYLAPERIQSDMFRLRLSKMNVQLLAVDEAHCISQWGYDFRPAYLKIKEIREILPKVPVIALTASATPEVQADIQAQLEMREPQIFRKSFRRENLRYFVLQEESPLNRLIDMLHRSKGCTIVYARTRKTTERLAELLNEQQLSAAAYHGGLKSSERSDIQQAWLEDRTRIMVATNAFGMGIDKPDVRLVVHFHLPFDLESYYQEAGRGGRDGKTALAVAFQSEVDIRQLERWNRDKYPTWKQLQTHYQALCQYFQIPKQGRVDTLTEFSMPEVASATKISGLQLYASLKVLQQEGVLHFQEDKDDFAYVQIIAAPSDLMRFQEQHPRFMPLIQFMLRQLGGDVYIQERRLLPELWARRLDLPPIELYDQLERLAQHELILYTPATDKPMIRFFRPYKRLVKRDLNWEKYDFLRKQSDRRLKEMLAYIADTKTCRSVLIQRYFGELALTPCGKCDVCSGRFKEGMNGQEMTDIRQAIFQYVEERAATYSEVIHGVKAGSPTQVEKVLRYLMDKEIILVEMGGRLRVKE
ncbi:MAG: RecQ family ATP-dependent DNA helicase, partial [Bacteroidota bacterium]